LKEVCFVRLQLDILFIRDVLFSDETTVRDGILHVKKKALQNLLLEDQRFAAVDVELARPGEDCRIIRVLDVIEPRAKTSDGDEDFPGAVGRQTPAGTGSTCVLKGVAVVLSDFREAAQSAKSADPSGDIIDMSGPGAEVGLFGKTHNIVVLPVPAKGVSGLDYLAALKIAGLKAAAFLARAGKGVKPDETEVMELPPLVARDGGTAGLPRVVYIFQILTLQFDPIPGEPILYGRNVPDMVPTLLHPNEVIDGALTSPFSALNVQTYQVQNHPVIRELSHRHGKDLFFAGVIVSTAPNNMADIERISNMAANLAKYVGADGAVLTKTGGGAPELTLARTAQRCEGFGIKTALAILHLAADVYGGVTLFNMPEVDAIVSLGVPSTRLLLPRMARIIGRRLAAPGFPPIEGEIVRSETAIRGAQCQLGGFRLRAVRH
jgi:sarcosine reductase